MHARTLWLVLGMILVLPRGTRAQPVTVQAQSLFDEGLKLTTAGRIGEACDAFEASQKLDPNVVTLLQLAACRERNHQLATAWGVFLDAYRMARDAGNDRFAKVASGHAHRLEPRLSRLMIRVAPDHQVPGLRVRRGKELVNPVSWNHSLPIDGGTYTIVAQAPGRQSWSTTQTIQDEGDNQTIEIPALVAATNTASPVASAGDAPSPGPIAAGPGTPDPLPPTTTATSPIATSGRAAVEQDSSRRFRMTPVLFGATALALGGASLGFDLWGNRRYDDGLVARTQMQRDSLYREANTRRYIAEGLGAAALVSAGAAVYFYLRTDKEPRTSSMAMLPVTSSALTGVAAVMVW